MLFHTKKSKQSSRAYSDGCGDLRLEVLPLLSHGRVSAPLSSLSDRGTPDPPPYPWAGLSSSFPEASEKITKKRKTGGHTRYILCCQEGMQYFVWFQLLLYILRIVREFNMDMNFKHAKHRECTYCFDALMKDRFVDEVEFAKFPDEFNVAKHLDLGNGTLLLLLRSKRVVMFVIDWSAKRNRSWH